LQQTVVTALLLNSIYLHVHVLAFNNGSSFNVLYRHRCQSS